MEAVFTVFKLGLLLMAIGWLIQALAAKKGKKQLQRGFLLGNIAGIVLMLLSELSNGLLIDASLGALVFVLALVVAIKTPKK